MNTFVKKLYIGKTVSREKEKSGIVPKSYMSPYTAGIGLGLVLLAAFVFVGHGLGASGAFTTTLSTGLHGVSPAFTESNSFFSGYNDPVSGNPLNDWYVIEIIGVLLGGFLSGILARRVKLKVDKGPAISTGGRFIYAFAGGFLMGIGAKLARGCTSGQALTGGALLNVGSWIFMIMIFAGGYSAAYFVKRQWQ